jgi:hypothetical protein
MHILLAGLQNLRRSDGDPCEAMPLSAKLASTSRAPHRPIPLPSSMPSFSKARATTRLCKR